MIDPVRTRGRAVARRKRASMFRDVGGRIRAAALVGGVLLLGAGLGGCTGSASQPPAVSKAQQDHELADLKARVVTIPGVVNASLHYVRQATLQAPKLEVGVEVRQGQAADPMTQEVVRLVWTSPLTPVELVGVTVVHEGQQDRRYLLFSFADANTRSDLTSRYGPRPTATAGS